MEPRTVSNAPIFLNGLAKALLIIDDGLAWKIGNGNKVLLGVDPRVGGAICYKFSYNLVESLTGGMCGGSFLIPTNIRC